MAYKKALRTIEAAFRERVKSHGLGSWEGNKQVEELLKAFYTYGALDRTKVLGSARYTRMPEQYDRRKKLMKRDIAEIRMLRAHGWSIHQLAEKFHVSDTTICLWCDDKKRKENYRRSVEWRKQHPVSNEEAYRVMQVTLMYKRKLREEGKL